MTKGILPDPEDLMTEGTLPDSEDLMTKGSLLDPESDDRMIVPWPRGFNDRRIIT